MDLKASNKLILLSKKQKHKNNVLLRLRIRWVNKGEELPTLFLRRRFWTRQKVFQIFDHSMTFADKTVFLKPGLATYFCVEKILQCDAKKSNWKLLNVITLLIVIWNLVNQGHFDYINQMITFSVITFRGVR
jgi:hypothetical protein